LEKETFVSSQFSLFNSGILGESPSIDDLLRQIVTAARCDLTVLVSGESGTGKELVARAIHEQSARAMNAFVSVNCGALTETLLESELFGYERGAFTGANEKRKGLFEAAHNGTIFLDEIGEMSPACQVKLLRVLQESTIRPIGARSETRVDARVITATNRNLAHEMPAGRFREDLFYRIAVLTINTPPLRKHVSDIPLLIEHFLCEAEQKIKCSRKHTIEQEGITVLSNYGWPGNVRQLRHVVERLVATTMDGEIITADAVRRALPNGNLSGAGAQVPLLYHENDSLEAFLDRTLLTLYDQLLAKTGNHSQAARLLRIDRTSLYQRLERARRRMQDTNLETR
jgi:transcriptional regulator with PAS, ATPase and Fis domain